MLVQEQVFLSERVKNQALSFELETFYYSVNKLDVAAKVLDVAAKVELKALSVTQSFAF